MKKIGIFAYGEMGESVLTALQSSYEIAWVIVPPSVDQTEKERRTEMYAKKLGITISYISKQAEIYTYIKKNTPEAVVIGSFNKILSEDILKITKFINIHLGDLPRYRGRANVNWAIINGRKEIGISVHQMVAELDAGNIYKQKMVTITNRDSVLIVYEKINLFIIKELAIIVEKVLNGYQGTIQKGKATYCCTRLPQDGLIDWNQNNKSIYNLIRGITYPYPGAFSFLDGKKIIIWTAEIPINPKIYEGAIPGRVASVIKGVGVEVITGKGIIMIKEVSYKGKKQNASQIIKSVKKTLGIDWVEVYERIMK